MSEPKTLEPVATPLRFWHEDMGPQLWWVFPICEPPYCGSPLDDDWPGYHTHYSPIPLPAAFAPHNRHAKRRALASRQATP